MLRKSHSTDLGDDATRKALGAAALVDPGHAVALHKHADEMRAEFAELTGAFGAWADAVRALLTDERDAYARSLDTDREGIEGMRRQLAAATARRQEIVAALQDEQREYDEGARANAELAAHRDRLQTRLARIREEASALEAALAVDEAELSRREASAAQRVRRDRAEAAVSEDALGLRVETVGGDEGLIRFTFARIDPKDPARRFVLVLDTSTARHRVVSCEPPLPQLARMLMVLDSPGASGPTCGDLGAFLRSVRDAFVAAASSSRPAV